MGEWQGESTLAICYVGFGKTTAVICLYHLYIMIDQLHSLRFPPACLVKVLSVQGALIRAFVLRHVVNTMVT